MSANLDRRTTPARPDLAAAHLKGKVEAERFAHGREVRAARGTVALRKAPDLQAAVETQILYGESFIAYEETGGWLWGQSRHDSYVGYARAGEFAPDAAPATHRVIARATPVLQGPDVKRPVHDFLPLNAKMPALEIGPRFVRMARGYVFVGHLAPLSSAASDWVAVAESFIGVPYVWGGKTVDGCDCSGLIQTALEAGGIAAPRDTDMMESALGRIIAVTASLRRGDLVFWRGHMGVMVDSAHLLHANAHFMEVTVEPLETVRKRVAAAERAAVRTVKRL